MELKLHRVTQCEVLHNDHWTIKSSVQYDTTYILVIHTYVYVHFLFHFIQRHPLTV